MAATGYTPIILFNSTTASAVPTTSNLAVGELALNIPDGKLYFNQSGTIKVLAGAGGAGVVGGSNTQVQYNSSGAFAGSANMVFDGSTLTTLNTAYTGTLTGGTGVVNLGSGQFYKDASGNVLIGNTTDPLGSNKLLVQSSGTGNNNRTFSVYNTAATSTTAFANRLVTINSLGSGADATINFSDQVANNAYMGMGSGALYFATGGTTERMRITSAGLVCINGTSGTALATIASSTTYPALKVPNIVETANTVAGAPASTQTFYLASGAVQYYTSNATNNWTVNFAMSAGTSMNTAMAIGDSMSCTMLTTQGSTAYYNSAVQIDGASVTPKWQGGTAPTSGNASGIDSYTYVIYKTASATYTVLASQTKFA